MDRVADLRFLQRPSRRTLARRARSPARNGHFLFHTFNVSLSPFVLHIVHALLAVSLLFATAAPSRPNIVLLVLDTVRYDAISPANTPFLDSLARRGVVFSQAYSTHDFTPTSHFSMETGFRDGLGTDDDRPENGVAWQLGKSGYSTFAAAANGRLAQAQMPVHKGYGDFKLVGDITGVNPNHFLEDILSIDARLALFRVRPTHYARAMVYFSAERVLERELLRDRLDEAGHDQRRGLGLREPARHQVEELLLADLRDRRLVPDVDLILVDLDVRVRVGARVLVEDQGVADDLRLRAFRTLRDLEQSAVAGPSAVLGDRLGRDHRGGVRRDVDGLTACVLVLPVAREGDREHLAVRALAEQPDRRVLHRQLRAEVAVEPPQPPGLVGEGAPGGPGGD